MTRWREVFGWNAWRNDWGQMPVAMKVWTAVLCVSLVLFVVLLAR